MVGLNRKNLFILAFGSLVLAGCGGNDDVIADVSGGDTGATCGDSVCNADEKCVDGVCKPKDNADTGTKCGDSVCNADEECVDDVCTPKGNGDTGTKCGGAVCNADEKCADGVCKPKDNADTDTKCGNVVCNADEICVEDECKPAALKCGSVVCRDDEVCFQGACRATGDCGGAQCQGDETCHDGMCRVAGDCNGVACYPGETCFFGECKPKGDCWGIKCADDEVCYDNLCRKIGDCGGVQCDEVTEYCYNETCYMKDKCGDVYCDADYTCGDDGSCVLRNYCLDGRVRCGTDCCDLTQFCGSRKTCCDADNSCGNDCCREGEVCEFAACQKDCGTHQRCTLTDGTTVCCGDGEICTSNQCFKPSVTCIDNYMCENSEYCDQATNTCLPKPTGEACFMTQKGGEVQPTLLWYWGKEAPAEFPQHVQVMSSPMVMDMDGDTIPDVVFNSFSGGSYQGNGIIRIVNGKTGKLIASSTGKDNEGNGFMTDGGSQVALGDLDGDTIPEIVTCSDQYRLATYKFDPKTKQISLLWKSNNPIQECGQGGPGIADFDGDGKPEVYVRYHIHDGATGELLGSERCLDVNGNSLDHYQAHAPCDYSVAADLDGDGKLELVGGNVAYRLDKQNKKLVEYYNRRNDGHPDGYPAVADIDLDENPEIFVVRSNEGNTVMVFNHDGTDHWKAPIRHDVGGGGAPTIANITGDAHPEMTFAGRTGYIVFDYLGNVLWRRTTQDDSSAKTGSSVFDFDGDGKAEIVYADELFLRVYNGDDGETVYCQCNTSGTHWEYPVIADVNNDGHAEIIVSSNNSMTKNCPNSLSVEKGWDKCIQGIFDKKDPSLLEGTHGVHVFSSPNRDWVNTRKVYNQHAYSVTNISDNGTVPKHQRANWNIDGLNNFRLNVQPGANYLPNLKITNVSNPYTCDNPSDAVIYFVVENVGWATAEKGITVKIYRSDTAQGEYKLLGSVQTISDIRAAQREQMTFKLPDGEKLANGTYIHIALGDDAPTQCKVDGNSVTYEPKCQVVVN